MVRCNFNYKLKKLRHFHQPAKNNTQQHKCGRKLHARYLHENCTFWGEGYNWKVTYFKNKDKSGYEDMGREQ
jgi:hypothetical protein